MKKYISLLSYLLFIPLIAFMSCEDDEKVQVFDPELEILEPTVTFTAAKNSRTVEIKTTIKDWTFEFVNENDSKWVKLSKDGGLKVEIAENKVLETRTAKVRIQANDLEKEVNIVQKGLIPEFKFDKSTLNFAVGGATQEIKVTTNVYEDDWNVAVADEYKDWISAERKGKTTNADGETQYIVAITTLAYEGYTHRPGAILIESNWLANAELESVKYPLTQTAVAGTFTMPEPELLLPFEETEFSFTISSPQQLLPLLSTDIPKWMKDVESEVTGDDATGYTLTVTGVVIENPKVDRTQKIVIRLNENNATATITINQEGKLAFVEIKLTASSFFCNVPHPKEGADYGNLVDNNTATFWHSSWAGDRPKGVVHYLMVDLGEGNEIDPSTYWYFQFTARAGNDNNAHTPGEFMLQGSLTSHDWFNIKEFKGEADGIPKGQAKVYDAEPLCVAESIGEPEEGSDAKIAEIKAKNEANRKSKIRYIRFWVTKSITGNDFFCLSEFKMFQEKK